MDDQNFKDPKTAQEWIQIIENDGSAIRHQDIYPRLRNWADRVAPAETLEIGAGQGACSDAIDIESRRYTGIDPSPLLIQRAQALYPTKTFLLGNAYALPFSSESFDAVFSVAVWHLLSDLNQAATEMSRVLRENGRFLIITANPGAYSPWTNRYTDSKIEGLRFEGRIRNPDQSFSTDVLYLHTLEEISRSLTSADLQIHKVETFRPSPSTPESHQWIALEGQKI